MWLQVTSAARALYLGMLGQLQDAPSFKNKKQKKKTLPALVNKVPDHSVK